MRVIRWRSQATGEVVAVIPGTAGCVHGASVAGREGRASHVSRAAAGSVPERPRADSALSTRPRAPLCVPSPDSSIFSLFPKREEPADAQNSDALSTSSGLLDLLLHEDLCSATGSALSRSGASATSDSLGSGSLGCDTSRSGTGSSDTSHTSKYFGSIDSSENNHQAKMKADMEESEHFIKYVLQDPVWLLMADTDDSVMMTYQMPSRNLETVLKEDREKLKAMQKSQPRFTEGQRQELQEVHPWLRAGGLPTALDLTECVYCENQGQDSICVPYEEDSPTLGPSEATDTQEEERGAPSGRSREEQT